MRPEKLLRHFVTACVAVGVSWGQGIITTVAGTDLVYPGSSFSALSASFGQLSGVAVNPISGDVYFASQSRSLIVKFNPQLNSASVVAGIGIGGYSGDGGPASAAALNQPVQIAFDRTGSLFIADSQNNAVRKIDPQGVISTVAAGIYPIGVAIASDGTLYASNIYTIVRIAVDGTMTVIAGSVPGYSGDRGPATDATLNFIQGLAFDAVGNLFVTDQANNRIRRIGTDGIISTVAGNGQFGPPVAGPAIASPLGGLASLTVDRSGNLYFGGGGLLKVDSKGVLSILNPTPSSFFLAASGSLTNASLDPNHLAFDQGGNLYITEAFTNCLYRSSPGGIIQAVAGYAPNFGIGDGPALLAGLNVAFRARIDA